MGILAALLTVLIAISLFVLPSAKMGNITPQELLSRNDTSVVWNALQSAISEAKTNALSPDTNYLNYTSGSHLPLYGTSGSIYATIDESASPKLSGMIAGYQTIVLGARNWRNADGTGIRERATNYLEKGYIAAKATTCVNVNGKSVAGDMSIAKVTPHEPVCALGTPVSIFAVATINLSVVPYAIEDIQYYSDGSNLGLGHNVFIPGTGGTANTLNFDATWQDIATSNDLDDFPVDLQSVIFRTDDFNDSYTYNQTVAGLDTTADEVPDVTNIIFNYNGTIDKRSVYLSLDTQGADHTLGINTPFKVYDANGTDYTDKIRVYLVYGRGEQIAITPTEPEGFPEFVYTGTPGTTTPDGLVDLPEADNEYVIYYPPNSLSDMYNHTDASLPTYVYFRVGDGYETTAGDANCPNNAIHDISTSGSVYAGDASPCDNEIWNLNYNSASNTINAGTGDDTVNFDGNSNTFNGQGGSDLIRFGGIDSYATGGTGTDMFSTGVEEAEPNLVITDVNNDCSELLFELYDVDPSTPIPPDIDSYQNFLKANGTLKMSLTLLNDVEKVAYTDITKNFGDVCSVATTGGNIYYVDVNGETETGSSGDDQFIITADNAFAVGMGGNDRFVVQTGIKTTINGGAGSSDIAYFPLDAINYDVVYDASASKYIILDAGGSVFSPGAVGIYIDSTTEYYDFNGNTMDYATMLSSL